MYQLRRINKLFGGVHALRDVDFEIRRGEVVGLVGENGAGKSTLMKIIYGAYQPDAGEILIDGAVMSFANPRAAMDAGIGMVFQEQSLIPNLSVMENIFLSAEDQFARCGMVNWKKMAKAAREQLAKIHLDDIDPRRRLSKLPFAQRQLVEIAKVLALEERSASDLVMLLDEPTSVLSRDEVKLLFGLIEEMRERSAIIFVSHHLDEVLAISDRIYVLKDGEVSATYSRAEADASKLQHAMVGRAINTGYYSENEQGQAGDAVLLEVANLTRPGKYQDISFKLHAGEVLALVGVEGSGCQDLMRQLFGLDDAPASGTISLHGERVDALSPKACVEHGLGYVPCERKIEGIVGGMALFENITLPSLGNYSYAGLLNAGVERADARSWIKRLSIKAPSEKESCGRLSGGNQQKVVLARCRNSEAGVILFDHPTRGLDIGAKEDVYKLVREMSAAGIGIVLIADSLEEAIGLAHNIVVMRDGEITRRFSCEVGAKPAPLDLIAHMM